MYFEEVLQHEKREMDKAKQGSGGSTNSVTGTIGNDDEEYAFEDLALNPTYSDPYEE